MVRLIPVKLTLPSHSPPLPFISNPSPLLTHAHTRVRGMMGFGHQTYAGLRRKRRRGVTQPQKGRREREESSA